MEEINLRIVLSFDGSSYSGWQRQKNAASIQGEIERSLSYLYGKHIDIAGIGRTDAGAHALSYTANFRVKSPIPPEKLPYILNRSLPSSIRIHSAVIAPHEFHSRFSATAREYIYSIIIIPKLDKTSERRLPFYSRYSYCLQENIDISRLHEICPCFKGSHSFRNFSYGYKSGMNFNRFVNYLRFRESGARLIFFIKGSGFLNGMIRSVISACLNYAKGSFSLDMVRDALEDRIVFPVEFRAPVPACGLIFKRGYFKDQTA
jgi:tRNA pseudouridine38-40 synthase